MYKKILVPLDGSKRAEAILSHVEMLARCLKAEVILLRVFMTDFGQVDYYGHDPKFYEVIRAGYKDSATDYLNEVLAELLEKDLQVRVIVEEGVVIDTILSIAQVENVDLIAMSSHGRTGLARAFYGSVADGVLHRVDRPLLVIRAEKD